MKKITLTLEESLVEKLSRYAMRSGLKKTQIVRQALQKYFAEAEKSVEKEVWLAENRDAIETYNRHIEKNGLFGQEHRSF